jgi:hypothetical protein
MMDTLCPQILLISVDFPLEGLPTRPTKAAFTRFYARLNIRLELTNVQETPLNFHIFLESPNPRQNWYYKG